MDRAAQVKEESNIAKRIPSQKSILDVELAILEKMCKRAEEGLTHKSVLKALEAANRARSAIVSNPEIFSAESASDIIDDASVRFNTCRASVLRKFPEIRRAYNEEIS